MENRDDKNNISNQLKLAMAFHIWNVLDYEEYGDTLDYIAQNKWVLFTLVMTGYQKLIRQKKKSGQEVVSEIAWATGYIIPPDFDYHFCGYDISVTRHPQREQYLITPSILKNAIDIDFTADDGEKGSVLYELKQLPLSCWFNLKDTIRKYNRTWEEDIRTNLYQWMGAGYQYVMDFYSFINICAYHQIRTTPLQSVWQEYMKPAVQKPLIYIAKDFPEYRSFWNGWYNELYRYAYEMFDLAEESFQWDVSRMRDRAKRLTASGLWLDRQDSGSSSVNKNAICIDARSFAEKWLERPIDSSDRKPEFHGFFTNPHKPRPTASGVQETENISMDEIREIISLTSADTPQNEETAQQQEEGVSSKLKKFLSGIFSKKKEPEAPPQTMESKYRDILERRAEDPVFHGEVITTKEHIEQIQSRLQKINAILSQHFTPREMTYKRFISVVEEATTRFYANVKTIIKRMDLFDTEDYLKISQADARLSVAAKRERMRIYTEHIKYIHKLIDANDSIVSKLDGLLLELAKLEDFSEESLLNNPAINELNDLIEQTKFYKQ